MGLTMHSPGGIPGVSSAVMWNDTAASRQWGSYQDPFYLGYAVAAGLSLTGAGLLYRAGILGAAARTALVQGTKPRTWAAYNIYKEFGDLKHWARGGEFQLGLSLKARPITTMYFPYPIAVPFPWVSLNPVDESSSQTYQQNGGSSAPSLHISKKESDILSLGRISRPSIRTWVSSTESGGGRRRKVVNPRKGERCPPGYYWHAGKRACILNIHSPHWKRQ